MNNTNKSMQRYSARKILQILLYNPHKTHTKHSHNKGGGIAEFMYGAHGKETLLPIRANFSWQKIDYDFVQFLSFFL